MSVFAKSTLQQGEYVVLPVRLHWIRYAGAAAWMLAAVTPLFVLLVTRNEIVVSSAWIAAGSLAPLGMRSAAVELWIGWTTEITVTNYRVLIKTGFIRRKTFELYISRIEGVELTQSVLGRLLNYGSIHIHGSGGNTEHLHFIADPLAVQRAIRAA